MNYPLILLSALAISYLAGQGQMHEQQAKLFDFATKSLDNPSKRYLWNHGCKVILSKKREDRGPSRWTKAVFKCRNLEDQFIPTVLCDKSCVNPLRNCRRLRTYRNEQVLYKFPLKSRNNATTSVQIPVACQCVLRRSRRTCSNRRQRHW